MAKTIPYLDGNGKVIEKIDDPKNPQVYFDPNDPASKSFTSQSEKDIVDINKIMERYEKTGSIIVNGQERQPIYGDFTTIPNFHEVQNSVAKLQQAFDVLPAKTRSRFGNDPQNLIDFLQDTENDSEALKLGLKSPEIALVALADDGKTKITQAERNALDLAAQAKKQTQPPAAPAQPANPAA